MIVKLTIAIDRRENCFEKDFRHKGNAFDVSVLLNKDELRERLSIEESSNAVFATASSGNISRTMMQIWACH